ncbi:MAG TPA: OsmC family protein [Sphaerochaetaceae bacterium]|jgi:peroxiredoxin-like protein|nr:OsmC family protein [Sphaerochaetaceae bacterium]
MRIQETTAMSEHHAYRTQVQWSTQRKGKLSSAGFPTIEIATPPDFPGGHAGIWSPEHLFVGAAEICLMTTFLSLAEKTKLDFHNYVSEAEGILEKAEGGLQITKISIRPSIVVATSEDTDKALKLIEKAERYCLISNSMKTEVSIEPTVTVLKEN